MGSVDMKQQMCSFICIHGENKELELEPHCENFKCFGGVQNDIEH